MRMYYSNCRFSTGIGVSASTGAVAGAGAGTGTVQVTTTVLSAGVGCSGRVLTVLVCTRTGTEATGTRSRGVAWTVNGGPWMRAVISAKILSLRMRSGGSCSRAASTVLVVVVVVVVVPCSLYMGMAACINYCCCVWRGCFCARPTTRESHSTVPPIICRAQHSEATMPVSCTASKWPSMRPCPES